MPGKPAFCHLREHLGVEGILLREGIQIIFHLSPVGRLGALPHGEHGAVAHVKAGGLRKVLVPRGAEEGVPPAGELAAADKGLG